MPAPDTMDVAAIHARHGNHIWMTLQRMGVRPADLEDVYQEVLVVAHRRLGSYDPAASLASWLFGICLRVTAAYRRRAHRRHEQLGEPAPEQLRAADGQSPEEQASAGQRRRRLQEMLDELDPAKRAVFVMFEVDELPCEEIARLIGVPLGTVYSRLHAARRDLLRIAARWRAREDREERT